jgi:hypothetical protein
MQLRGIMNLKELDRRNTTAAQDAKVLLLHFRYNVEAAAN